MKIYTKSGDKGETSLLSGNRVSKNHARIEAYGSVDELSSFIGYLRAYDIDENSKIVLFKIQKVLFSMGSLLALDENKYKLNLDNIKISDIEFLENEIDAMNENLPKLTEFIIPGGSKTAGLSHVCRTVCRRCERLVVGLEKTEDVDNNIIQYLNRLSDYFFVLARKFDK